MAKKYLFSDTGNKPVNEDNLKFKKRLLAVNSASNFLFVRLWWFQNNIHKYEVIDNCQTVSGLSREISVDTVYNGETETPLPKKETNSGITITFSGSNKSIEEWYNKASDGYGNYMCDVLVFLLNDDLKTFRRCYAFKNAWVNKIAGSDLNTKADATDTPYELAASLVYEKVRSVDMPFSVELTKQSGEKIEIKKDTANFYADKTMNLLTGGIGGYWTLGDLLVGF